MKIVFASNSLFGTTILKELLKRKIKPDQLITFSDKKSGRGKEIRQLPIKEFATEEGIKIRESNTKEEFHKIIEEENPDFVIVAGFSIIILPETLKLSKFINIHPSLLPKYRGSTPIQTAILNGDKESGTTIIEMNDKIDQGPILDQEIVLFHDKINYKEAEEVLAKKGGEMLADLLPLLIKEEVSPRKQDDSLASYTNILTKEDGRINWNEPAEIIERKIRAFNPWPGTYTTLNDKIVKIHSADVQKITEAGPFGPPGKMYLGTNNTIAIQTKKDFLLIKNLQVEGKKPSDSKDFIQGNINLIGSILI